MAEVNQGEKPALFIAMNGRQLAQVVIIGVLVGCIVYVLTYLLNTYVYPNILCRGSAMRCTAGTQYGEITANILAAGGALFALVRLQIFRPLLVVIASTISLWNIIKIMPDFPWYLGVLVCGLLFAVAYATFVWLARVRTFWVVAILMAILVAAVRLVLSS